MLCNLHDLEKCSECYDWSEPSLPRQLYGQSFFAPPPVISPHLLRMAEIKIKAPERLTEILMKLNEVRLNTVDADLKAAVTLVQTRTVQKIAEILFGELSVNTKLKVST